MISDQRDCGLGRNHYDKVGNMERENSESQSKGPLSEKLLGYGMIRQGSNSRQQALTTQTRL